MSRTGEPADAAPEDPALRERARALELAWRPGRWPGRVFFALGLVCLGGAVWSWVELAQTRSDRQAVRRQIDVTAGQVDEAGVDASAAVAALQASEAGLRTAESLWGRRRLGLCIAAGVLLVGAYVASAVQRLYDKLSWVQIDPPS